MQGQPPASDEDRLGRRGGTVTERERKKRAAVKKELQKEGVLPPNRPRVNRRKYAQEAIREYEETIGNVDEGPWLRMVIGMMVSKDMKRVSDEEMGVLRMLRLAAGTKKFHERLRAEGREKYSMREFYNEVYAPIMGLEAEENGLPDDW